MSLVGVDTYEKILRPTRNPTLAGIDPLSMILRESDTGRGKMIDTSVISVLVITCLW